MGTGLVTVLAIWCGLSPLVGVALGWWIGQRGIVVPQPVPPRRVKGGLREGTVTPAAVHPAQDPAVRTRMIEEFVTATAARGERVNHEAIVADVDRILAEVG